MHPQYQSFLMILEFSGVDTVPIVLEFSGGVPFLVSEFSNKVSSVPCSSSLHQFSKLQVSEF